MLEFWQNGTKIEGEAIYSRGKVGQMVIFSQRDDRGVNHSHTQSPLSQYSSPSLFTIVDKNEEVSGCYILSDINGKCIRVSMSHDGCYLYDAQEWLTWNDMYQKEKLSRKQRKIEQLEGYVELLKGILIKQGVRIVTEAQAKNLGL